MEDAQSFNRRSEKLFCFRFVFEEQSCNPLEQPSKPQQ